MEKIRIVKTAAKVGRLTPLQNFYQEKIGRLQEPYFNSSDALTSKRRTKAV